MLTCHLMQELNDEAIIESVDFSEFEALFQVKRFKKNDKSSKRDKSKYTLTVIVYSVAHSPL